MSEEPCAEPSEDEAHLARLARLIGLIGRREMSLQQITAVLRWPMHEVSTLLLEGLYTGLFDFSVRVRLQRDLVPPEIRPATLRAARQEPDR